MVYKDVPKGDTVRLNSDEQIDVPHEGEYLEGKPVNTKYGEMMLYKFRDKSGKTFTIWGFATLDSFMENVKAGNQCRLTYKGRSDTPNKFGKYIHLCKVEVNDGKEDEKSPDIADSEIPF